MPHVKHKPLEEREAYFVKLFIDKGALEEYRPDCERRAHLKPGSGKKILKRKKVQEQIRSSQEQIRLEHERQKWTSEAVAKAAAVHQEQLKAQVKRLTLCAEELDHQLMMGAVGLDWQIHPKEKLDVLKAAYVVLGTLESANTRRLIPLDNAPSEAPIGLYTSLFNRLALNPSNPTPSLETPQNADPVVFDLIPHAEPIPAPVVESVAAAAPKSQGNVITIELE